MKILFFAIALILAAASPVFAQSDSITMPALPSNETTTPAPAPAAPDPTPSQDRHCFTLVNKAPYTVHVSYATALGPTDRAGQQGRKSVNIRLAAGDSQQACSDGPFYDGGRLDFTLRSLVPLFECKTVAEGEIDILGEEKEDHSGTKTWIECR